MLRAHVLENATPTASRSAPRPIAGNRTIRSYRVEREYEMLSVDPWCLEALDVSER